MNLSSKESPTPSRIPKSTQMHHTNCTNTYLPLHFLPVPPQTSGEVCMFSGFRAHFIPRFLPVPPGPPEKCACSRAFVHTSPCFSSCSAPDRRRSMHVPVLSCTLHPPFSSCSAPDLRRSMHVPVLSCFRAHFTLRFRSKKRTDSLSQRSVLRYIIEIALIIVY